MRLLTRLFLGVSALFLALVAGIAAIYLFNARANLEAQLASQSQDAATAIAMRLATLPSLEDRRLVEAIVNPVFDRGFFQQVDVLSRAGTPIVSKARQASGEVPEWFARLFPMQAQGAQALVSTGWQELGRVVAVSHAHFAHRQLWQTSLQTLAWLAGLYVLALAAVMAFLSVVLRPLKRMEEVAAAISRRDFQTISPVPRAPELATTVEAMNSMSGTLARIIAEEVERAELLRREAFMDPLTGLYNRRGFDRQLQSMVQSRGDVFTGALLVAQIENFSAYNARAGYQAGDDLLRRAAQTLSVEDRSRMLGGRLGGAGFVVAALNVSGDIAEQIASEATHALASLLIEEVEADGLRVHCGVTHWEGRMPQLGPLLASADHALQAAREKGEHAFAIEHFDPAAAAGSLAWRNTIVDAIEQGHVVAFAQAVYGLPERNVIHGEITARIARRDADPVTAGEFMPMAARHGLVPRVDAKVVDLVLDHVVRRTGPSPRLAVNVSFRTVADRTWSGRLLDRLAAERAAARALIFEMTEFGALQDQALAEEFAQRLRALGAGFAIDHFSMHQDSIQLLHALKPDYIKLSPQYSSGIAADPHCRFFVGAVVRIAQPMGIAVFAQAVEDVNLLPQLAELGVAGYQGFAVSRPARISDTDKN